MATSALLLVRLAYGDPARTTNEYDACEIIDRVHEHACPDPVWDKGLLIARTIAYGE
jgi:hypothetical protein